MKIFKKSQNALEFVIILIFILALISSIILILGARTNDFTNKINQKEIDSFAQSILGEIKTMEKVQSGYSRKIPIPASLISRFNLTIDANRSFISVMDINWGNEPDRVFYYEFKDGVNISLLNESGKFFVVIYKNQVDNFSNNFLIINDVISTNPILPPQLFYLASNGITVMCPAALVGDTGVVNGITYTKRTATQITTTNANTTCTSSITNLALKFFNKNSFNQDISSWDTSSVTDLTMIFYSASSFNQPLNNWNTSLVTTMNSIFTFATSFNQPLNNWNTSLVTSTNRAFFNAISFNQPLNNWDMSSVTDMREMFGSAILFNQNINNWNVSSVINLNGIFFNASSFNQPLNNWDTSLVSNMNYIFNHASSFNQPLNNWNTSLVTSMVGMFGFTNSFNQPLNMWNTNSMMIPTSWNGCSSGATAWIQPHQFSGSGIC